MALETRDPVISLEHVRVQFGRRIVLEDISMTVGEGEFIVVLGPNGAGKSTLLKLLLGLVKQSKGLVQVLGNSPRRGNNAIGYAPQHRVLEADLALRARDVVGFGLDGNQWGPGLPSRKRNALIDQALLEVDAWDFADVPVGQLSGGEQQRVAVARALANSPRVLLADEPTGNLDSTRARELLALLREMVDRDKLTVMLVTHDHELASSFADRIIMMKDGRVQE